MTKAIIAPNVFIRLFNEFSTADSTDTLSHILYYKENDVMHVYMKYLGITYCTRIEAGDFVSWSVNFNNKIPLVEALKE